MTVSFLAALLALVPLAAPPQDRAPAPADAPARAQEPGAEKEGAAEEPVKKAFARLKSPQRKELQGLILKLRKEEDEERLAEARAAVLALGEGAIPGLLAAAARLEESGRIAELWPLLDALLADDDLHLAWKEVKKKTPPSVRRYLVRRWADSEREDAVEWLLPHLGSADPDVAYEAARGLLWRGDERGAEVVAEAMREGWARGSARFRADFAGIERGPMAHLPGRYLGSRKLSDQLLGLHLFELFGVPEQSRQLVRWLSESDTNLRLGAIDACRVVVAGEPPLERPSMTQIIELAEAWKARLKG